MGLSHGRRFEDFLLFSFILFGECPVELGHLPGGPALVIGAVGNHLQKGRQLHSAAFIRLSLDP